MEERKLTCENLFRDGGGAGSPERLAALWTELILRKERERCDGCVGEEDEGGG